MTTRLKSNKQMGILMLILFVILSIHSITVDAGNGKKEKPKKQETTIYHIYNPKDRAC